MQAHITAAVAAKPQLLQISTSYRAQGEGSTVLSRGKYVAISEERPTDKAQAKRREFKTCKYTTEAIITDGEGQGTVKKVCSNADCPVHHPKTKERVQDEAERAKSKAEQEKQRREEAIANTTGLRVLSAIGSAVPVRLLKRDLLFVIEKLVGTLEDSRIEMLARQHGIRQKRDDGGVRKTFVAFVRRAEEGTLTRLLVESTILLAASRGNPSAVLKDAANAYKVDTDAIAAKVKQEFVAKDKVKKTAQPATRGEKKVA